MSLRGLCTCKARVSAGFIKNYICILAFAAFKKAINSPKNIAVVIIRNHEETDISSKCAMAQIWLLQERTHNGPCIKY